MSLVSTELLANNLSNLKILDCSWHMPSVNRDSYNEYISEHIENAIFFDLDKSSDQNSDLPHMLPNKNYWEKIVSSMGISNDDRIVIYDNSDVIIRVGVGIVLFILDIIQIMCMFLMEV